MRMDRDKKEGLKGEQERTMINCRDRPTDEDWERGTDEDWERRNRWRESEKQMNIER